MSAAKRFEKIPYSIRPINYTIDFIPNVQTFKFNGSQKIDIEVKENGIDTVKLNAKELEVCNVTCNSKSAEVTYDADNELVIFKFPQPLEMGSAVLSMDFSGIHNDKMKGFYRSLYTNPNGETCLNLATQFEATSARFAFPCVDEPDRKATFCISMVVPSNKVAISNMPETSRVKIVKPADLPELQGAAHYERVSFDKTPIMSTYLLAMVIGDFEWIEDKDPSGVKIRVYAPPGKKHCCDFAMKVAKESLPFYSECFGVAYPLPKLDLIAIPDFAAGAMENWGLVTYRETALLIEPVESSLALKQRVALVVAHELAHMWFGNLVTMKWWTHLWLNEGFATWMEYLCVDKVCPEFDIWTTFTTSELSTAFTLDALKSSHPIEVEVGCPDEVDEIFDSISYAKGASVINMLYNWIGHESFFQGLRSYIAKFQYSNTQTEDLWDAFGASSGKQVCKVMSEWTKKMGYPVLKVHADASSQSLVFSQQRFLADGSPVTDGYSWPIPLTIAHSNKAKISHLIDPENAKSYQLQVPIEALQDILINPTRASFIRVSYSPDLMEGIKRMLSKKLIGPRDRLAILDDHISLGFAGIIPIADVLDLIQAYAGESHHIVWDSITHGLSHIRLLVEEYGMDHNLDKATLEAALNGFNRLYQKLAMPVFNELGWDPIPNEEHNHTFLRTQVLSVLGRTGCPDILQESKRRFAAHVNSVLNAGDAGQQINSNIRGCIYSTCMRYGGQDDLNRLLELYAKTNMADERVRILQCLGVAPQPELRSQVLQFGMSDQVRKQDRYAALISVNGAGPHGRREFWQFVKANIKNLPDDLGSPNLLTHVLKNACRHFAHPNRLEEVKAFWEANPVPCKRAVDQAMEEVGINISQLNRDGASLIEKLKAM